MIKMINGCFSSKKIDYPINYIKNIMEEIYIRF